MTGISLERTGDSKWYAKYTDMPEDLIDAFWKNLVTGSDDDGVDGDGDDGEDLSAVLR